MKKHTDSTSSVLSCPYETDCSGCKYLGLPYQEQQKLKTEHLRTHLADAGFPFSGEIPFHTAGAGQLRDRLDFSWINGKLGLYKKNSQDLVDIDTCLQLSPALQQALTEIREISWPVSKGSLRIRVGPQGQKGLWLDFANIDIKNLLVEKSILHKLSKTFAIEIGQRRKILFWNGQEFKLQDPQPHVWFQTWVEEQAVDLYCQIASFTQPSLKANKIICDIIGNWVELVDRPRVIEFGSGIGNLTLPVLAKASHVTACEIDQLSLQGLQTTLEHLPPTLENLKKRITIYRGDFQKKLAQDFAQFDLVLANPPRSGLMNFLNPLQELPASQRPPYFIYMSCFPESLVNDSLKLRDSGYRIRQLHIVDQFPQTAHYEVLCLFEREQS